MRRIEFKMNANEIQKITNAINNFEGDTEKTINEYLRNKGKETLIEEITNKIPISKKGKKHAKTHKWFQTEFYNLAIAITTSNDFYYLYFVNEGSGTSRKTGNYINFFEGSGKRASEKITEGLVKKIEETLK